MVSFWPFKGDDTSAASFEKVLASLSTKINRASARNDAFRQHQRRFKALWTIYTTLAYLVAALILTLVTGWSNWNAAEYTAIAGGPLVIYAVRTALDFYYNYRIANTQSSLDDLSKQREAAIEKLKAATKYNSTQQLLDKYASPKPSSAISGKSRPSQTKPGAAKPQPARTGLPPPPTANIPGRQPPAFPITPQKADRQQPATLTTSADFAPNAFSSPIASSRPADYAPQDGGHHWYDRVLDLVLGDDETQPKNRIVLVCTSCRLVNGQAPPGTRALEDVGAWRCSECRAWNGAESEARRMVKDLGGGSSALTSPGPGEGKIGDEPEMQKVPARHEAAAVKTEEEEEKEDEDEVDYALADSPPASSTRSKARQRRKVYSDDEGDDEDELAS